MKDVIQSMYLSAPWAIPLWINWLIMMAAYAVDRLVGDPQWIPHPVVGMGRAIDGAERFIRPFTPTPRRQRLGGALGVVSIVTACYVATGVVVAAAAAWHPYAGTAVSIWLASTTVASKGLERAAVDVTGPLLRGDIEGARFAVARIVGRDTDRLNEEEVLRATVESVAENTIDAIVAPLFFTLIGGAPAAMAYRAINTFDSMWGHRNDRYRHFGWAAAKIDDGANWIPARIAAVMYPVAASLAGTDGGRARRTMRRDARRHPSPNAGIPEAAVAGALGLRLGGWSTYAGRAAFRPYLGHPLKRPTPEDIHRTVRIMHTVSGVFMMTVSCLVFVISRWLHGI